MEEQKHIQHIKQNQWLFELAICYLSYLGYNIKQYPNLL